MEMKEMAKRIRASYMAKKRNEFDLGRLFVVTHTLATRVRADI